MSKLSSVLYMFFFSLNPIQDMKKSCRHQELTANQEINPFSSSLSFFLKSTCLLSKILTIAIFGQVLWKSQNKEKKTKISIIFTSSDFLANLRKWIILLIKEREKKIKSKNVLADFQEVRIINHLFTDSNPFSFCSTESAKDL